MEFDNIETIKRAVEIDAGVGAAARADGAARSARRARWPWCRWPPTNWCARLASFIAAARSWPAQRVGSSKLLQSEGQNVLIVENGHAAVANGTNGHAHHNHGGNQHRDDIHDGDHNHNGEIDLDGDAVGYAQGSTRQSGGKKSGFDSRRSRRCQRKIDAKGNAMEPKQRQDGPRNYGLPPKQGLYDPSTEHDAVRRGLRRQHARRERPRHRALRSGDPR